MLFGGSRGFPTCGSSGCLTAPPGRPGPPLCGRRALAVISEWEFSPPALLFGHPGALEGFASVPAEALEVVIPPDLLQQIPSQRLEALRGVLAQDPRPRYQEDPQRVYGFGFAGMEIKFSVSGQRLTVLAINSSR